MANNIHKVILLGQIKEGEDVEEVHENLAIVFDIDLKKIPKLLKKPTVIRKNLTPEYARAYQIGLEKIGVPCDIEPPINTDQSLKKTEDNSFFGDENHSIGDEQEDFSLIDIEETKTLVLDGNKLRVLNIKMPFWSMVILTIKWIFASIPALMILAAVGYLLQMAITMISGFL
jgi:hypothetical protein